MRTVLASGGDSALLTDWYQLRMLDSYLQLEMQETAVFEFFVRRLPEQRQFLVAAGLQQAIDFVLQVTWSDEELAWLREHGGVSDQTAAYLRDFRFTGDIHAMPEGTAFFADEPILRLTAPLPQAQVLESRLINILHFQTLIASKAVRCRNVAGSRTLVDFGMRRSHGGEAALWAARASFLAGFDGTATVQAGPAFGIPVFGTMAHSYIQAHDSEQQAFENFLRTSSAPTTLLVDTYDTLRGVERAIRAARREQTRSGRQMLQAVRLDSGDLAPLACGARGILDRQGYQATQVFCSGGIDEHDIAALLGAGAPIDGFGVGTKLDVSADAPALDCAYKLQEYAGIARRKLSTAKATWPGRKQVWRRAAEGGAALHDAVTLETESGVGRPLLQQFVANGSRIAPAPALSEIRETCRLSVAQLPMRLRTLAGSEPYEVRISDSLRALAAAVHGD